MTMGTAAGFTSAALNDRNLLQGAGIGALAGVVGYGAGWVGGGLINPNSGSYLAQIGKGGAVGALKGASVSLATNLAEGRIDTNGLWRSAAIGAALGAARPIVVGKDITERQEMLGARIVAEAVQGRDFSSVRFVEGGILQGVGSHQAITLDGLINFDAGRLAQSDWVRLIGHELGHVSQEQDVGLFRFQFNYVFGGSEVRNAVELDADFRGGSTCYLASAC